MIDIYSEKIGKSKNKLNFIYNASEINKLDNKEIKYIFGPHNLPKITVINC